MSGLDCQLEAPAALNKVNELPVPGIYEASYILANRRIIPVPARTEPRTPVTILTELHVS
jgi:hypothetical protein